MNSDRLVKWRRELPQPSTPPELVPASLRIIPENPVHRCVRLVHKHLWTIVACLTITPALFLLYAARQPRLYRATAKVVIYRDSPNAPPSTQSPENGDLDDYNVSVETQLRLSVFAARGRRSLMPLALSSILAIAFMFWVAGDALVHQSALLIDPIGDASIVNRSQIARDSFELVKQHPVLGWGLGTFPIVYPHVASWYTDSLVNAAHDDYVQLLVETGVVGLGLILAFVCLVFSAGLKRLRLLPISTTGAALLGCSGLLLHSFTDFNLHVPANAAMFFSLCGMICAAEGTIKQRVSALPLRVETALCVRGRRSTPPGRVTARPAATPTRSRFRWPTT